MNDPAIWLILLMLISGKLYRQWRVVEPAQAAVVLNRYVIDIALPALIIVALRDLQWQADLIGLVATPWLLTLIMAALIVWLARLYQWPDGVTGVLLLLVPLGNTAFLGYPIVTALLGEVALPAAVIYDQFGSFLLLSSYGLFIAARYGSQESISLRLIVMRILRFPPFIALIIALLPLPWPSTVLSAFSMIGASLVPVACFAVGLQWRIRLPRRHWSPLIHGLSAKLVLMPLLAWLWLWLMQTDHGLLAVGVLQSGMPSMITAGAIAVSAGLDEELSAALVGSGLIVALFSLALWQWLLV
ncbi:MAG: AEC family transporter [Wenzhouxiangellaceae bacterium]